MSGKSIFLVCALAAPRLANAAAGYMPQLASVHYPQAVAPKPTFKPTVESASKVKVRIKLKATKLVPVVTLKTATPPARAKEGSNIIDKQRRIVLESVEQDVMRINPDQSIPWNGTIIVRDDLVLDAPPKVGFKSNQSSTIRGVDSDQWTEVPSTVSQNQKGVPAGHTRYHFQLSSNTVRIGAVDSASWQRLEIQLVPFAESHGAKIWDHNFPNTAWEGNPDANYVLTAGLNRMQFKAQ